MAVKITNTPKTEFIEMVETLCASGKLDLTKRNTLVYPFSFNKDFEDTVIENLTDDSRSVNALKRGGIMTYGDLIEKWDEIKKIRNLGERSYRLIRNAFVDKYYHSLNVDGKAEFIMKFVRMNSEPERSEA